MAKKQINKNILVSAKERIQFIFENTEKIYTTFSGGKDSTIMLHLLMEEAKKRNRKIGLLFIDLEGQYKITIEHIQECITEYKEWLDVYWVCLPLNLRNAGSMYSPFWRCWDIKKKDLWIRSFPSDCIKDINYFSFFKPGMEFEEFMVLFGEWYSNGKETACFVGIRATESLNRFRTVSGSNKAMFKEKGYTTQITKNVYNVYPIYDWGTKDIWLWHYKNPEKKHNIIYDLMYKAGTPLKEMRICQPYGDDQRKGLWLFHLLEPKTWKKVVQRVNGANFTSKYATNKIMGYGRINKPKDKTWEKYSKTILETIPPKSKKHFLKKIIFFVALWEKRCYSGGIPDEAPYELESRKMVPSWRRITKVLLRNDYWCRGLSFTPKNSVSYTAYLKEEGRI